MHDPDAPSFRHRLAAIFPALEERGFVCRTVLFPRRRYGLRILERLSRLRELDLLVIAKLKLLPLEAQLVRSAARRVVYDFDDAIYLGKPVRLGDEVSVSRRDSLGVLLRSPEKREAMGRRGRRRVEQTFDLRVLAPRVADLYDHGRVESRAQGQTDPNGGRPWFPESLRPTLF